MIAMASHLKCDVCGSKAVGLRISRLANVQNAYCQACLDSGREPIGTLVASLCGCVVDGGLRVPEDFVPVIDETLAYIGEDFEWLVQAVVEFENDWRATQRAISEARRRRCELAG